MRNQMFLLMLLFFGLFPLPARSADSASAKSPQVRDLNTPRQFPEIGSRQEWTERAAAIRMQALVSCGLWPLPEKTDLKARVFDTVERDGYTIEKVAFQSYPGVYVAGNLYRPLGKGSGPFPGVLNPHGHWANGRMADGNDGSIAARCITFARLGMVAFSYDMMGYNDTYFPDHGEVPTAGFSGRHRRFATNHIHQLWGISQMGLQTWNSIRALDFLESLPDVDGKRLACTGESGGGTQTFMLGAVENRLAAVAPVVMVSHSMQGGCTCENAPGLRVEYSNMEISAGAAPIPQILVAATGDWTRTTPTIEGPGVAGIYRLLQSPEKMHFVRFDFGHNYNQTSREAVYGWFNKWLLGADSSEAVPEPPYTKEPDEALRVFPEGTHPQDAITENQLIQYLISKAEAGLQKALPTDRGSLAAYKRLMLPLWQHSLLLESPRPSAEFEPQARSVRDEAAQDYVCRSPKDGGTGLVVSVSRPADGRRPRAVVLADGHENGGDEEASLRNELLKNGWIVVAVKRFSPHSDIDQFVDFYTVYNRTMTQKRVRDLARVCTFVREQLDARTVVLLGANAAGPWSLLAAPTADAVIADCNQVDTSSDSNLLANDLFSPGLRKIGGFEGAALLSAPHPLMLHNTGSNCSTAKLKACYSDLGEEKNLTISETAATPQGILAWISKFK